jgi:hypothetical protein
VEHTKVGQSADEAGAPEERIVTLSFGPKFLSYCNFIDGFEELGVDVEASGDLKMTFLGTTS